MAGAGYLFPYGTYRPVPWLEMRLGAVFAWSSTDVVDPYAQRALSRTVNWRGGSSGARDLGFEVDGSILVNQRIADNLNFQGGVEGGIFLPGGAFTDASGQAMSPIGLGRLRIGLRYR